MGPPIIGVSKSIKRVNDLINHVSDTGLNVVISGETGVGKEVVAQNLYQKSPRCGKPFVKVNCAALPEGLLESELYGYERGAFTGAEQKKKGKFELAHGGVLFLDEIGDMPLLLQSKLLHVLQSGEFAPLGSEKELKTDTWLIAATNHNLEEEIKHKRFREEIIAGLNGLADSSPEEVIGFHVKQSGYAGALFADLKLMTNLPDKQLQNAISTLLSNRMLVQIDKENRSYAHRDNVDKLIADASSQLKNYHEKNPLKAGMPKEELKSKLPPAMGGKLFTLLLNQMKKSDEIALEEDVVRLFDFTVSMKIDQEDVSRKILAVYRENGLTPPYFKDLSKSLDIDASAAKDVLMLLVEQQKIIKVKEEMYFSSQAIEDLKKQLVDFFQTRDELTTPDFKEIAGVSRKYLIPLIEYFDSKNVTIRVGDIRKLRNG